MKKIIYFLLLSIVFIGCNESKKDVNKTQHQDIWLIGLGESKKEIEEILRNNHYDPIYEEKDNSLFTKNMTINYFGIDWDTSTVRFKNNKSVSIFFSRISPVSRKSEKLSFQKMSDLKQELSEHYGEMREMRQDEDEDTKIYRWFGKSYMIELVDMFDGEMVILSFFKDGYNPRVSEN